MTWGAGAFTARRFTLDAGVAAVLCLLLGARISPLAYVPAAGLIGIALAPVWLNLLPRLRLMTSLVVALVLAVLSGLILTQAYAVSHGSDQGVLIQRTGMILALIGGFGVLVYARHHLGAQETAVLYAIGMVAATLLDPPSAANPWRFTYSIPIIILTLAILWRWNTLIPQLIALVVLAGVGILNDARSNSGILIIAAVVLLWQRLSRALTKRRRRAGNVLGIVLLGAAIFQLLQFSIVEGFFGEATQARTVRQIEAGGSVLLGGRPEIAASAALIQRYPLGLGPGTHASGADIVAAKTAMVGIGYDPNNGYVDNFMFGSGIQVHSTLGNFWIWYGLPGLAACALMAAIVIWGLEHQLRNATLSALMAYLSLRFFWDLAFSPADTTMKTLTLTIPLAAVLIAVRPRDRSDSSTGRLSEPAYGPAAARTRR